MTHEHSQGGHSGHTHRHEHASTGEHTDPVCGMTVKPESPHRFDHAGREPAFAGRRCARIGCLAVRENGVVILAAGRKAFGRQHAAA